MPTEGACSRCGQGGYGQRFEVVGTPLLGYTAGGLSGPQFCRRCGHQFWSACVACDGRGKFDGGYCERCGRKRPGRKCDGCDGWGKVARAGAPHVCTGADPYGVDRFRGG